MKNLQVFRLEIQTEKLFFFQENKHLIYFCWIFVLADFQQYAKKR